MKIINKADLYICIILLGIAGVLLVFQHIVPKDGSLVAVYVEDKLLDKYELDNDMVVKIEGDNSIDDILCIEKGYAYMKEANCPDKYCLNQRKISKSGETIVCLPAKIIIRIESSSESGYDAISQ